MFGDNDFDKQFDRSFDQIVKVQRGVMRGIIAAWALGAVVSLAVLGLITWAAVHFIAKIW